MPLIPVDITKIKLDQDPNQDASIFAGIDPTKPPPLPGQNGLVPVDINEIQLDVTDQVNQSPGNDAGALNAGVYGFNTAVPFGGKIASGVGALGAKAYDVLSGNGDLSGQSVGDLYDQAQADVEETKSKNPIAALLGTGAGIVSTLPLLSSKVLFGSVPTQGIRGSVNAIPKIASELGSFAGGSEIAGSGAVPAIGNTILRGAKNAALAAPAGALYGAGESAPGEALQGAAEGANMAATVGGAIPVAGAALGSLLSPLTPKIEQGALKIASLAMKYNIPLGIDDLTNSRFYKGLISEGESVPFSGSAAKKEAQQNAFTSAVGKSIGVTNGKPLTPEVMSAAYDNISKQFDNLTKGKTFKMNESVSDSIAEITEVAESGGYGADGAKHLENYLKDLGANIGKDGVVNGETLAKLRGKLNRIGRNASDQNAKTLANDLENTISNFITDDAPEALRKAKYQYKNFLAIEPLAQKSQVTGHISPSLLTGRVQNIYGRQFTKGKAGELGDIARIGQLIKEQVPNSGTAQRTSARNILNGNLGVSPFLYAANPVAGALQAGSSIAGMVGNRLLQSRNYNPALVAKYLNKESKQAKMLLTTPATQLLTNGEK